ncbi:MAG TPA: histidine--tRNA ligase, partial [Candidatus Bathyarchaeota archaeon]|nr:histidine--tRNA ligase [Candidatus Bathyarchaeota archaeon]
DIITVRGPAEEVLSHAENQLGSHAEGLRGCSSLRSLLEYGEALGIEPYLSVDLSLARGLDYYTSSVFEVEALGYEDYGSIAGGGRYDEIVELFGGNPVPAVGISFGIDRLTPILDEKGVFQGLQRGARVYVAPIGEKPMRQALQITQTLRKRGISTLVDLMGRSLRKQLEYAAKKGVKWVVLVGERDLEKGVISLRDMVSGEQREIPVDSVVEEVS